MRKPRPTAADARELLDRGAGRRLGSVRLNGDAAHVELRLPVAVVTGTRPGPTAWINASLHGDEYLGPAAVGALLETLDPERVRGRIVFTPTLNPGALRAMQRDDPEHPADWNRIWAHGSPRDDVPGAVAWAERELVPRADVVLDLHSGGNRFFQAPFAVYPQIGGALDRQSSLLAKACGLPWIWAHRSGMLEGALITAAAKHGIPAVLLEVGGEGKTEATELRTMIAAVRGALAHARILSGRPRFLWKYHVFTSLAVLRNRKEGRWSRLAHPGDDVRRGQPLGRVLDLLGRELEQVTSPVSGRVCGITTYGYVAANDYVAEMAHHIRTESGPR